MIVLSLLIRISKSVRLLIGVFDLKCSLQLIMSPVHHPVDLFIHVARRVGFGDFGALSVRLAKSCDCELKRHTTSMHCLLLCNSHIHTNTA